jgi:hypothetical protein
MDRQAAEMDCIVLVSFTHTHARRHRDRGRTREIMAAFGLRVELLNAHSASKAAGHATWPPDLPWIGITLLAQCASQTNWRAAFCYTLLAQCSSQTKWRSAHLALHSVHLAQLRQVGSS